MFTHVVCVIFVGNIFCFILQELLEPDKGYVKDDSITLEVFVKADAPHGVRYDIHNVDFIGIILSISVTCNDSLQRCLDLDLIIYFGISSYFD